MSRLAGIRCLTVAALLAARSTAAPADAAQGTAGKRSSAISLRKRLHVNPLITEPDTIDIEWGGSFSTDGNFTMPTAIHYTPQGSHVWWGRTEFSASFDSLAYQQPTPHFGDRGTFAPTCVVDVRAKL